MSGGVLSCHQFGSQCEIICLKLYNDIAHAILLELIKLIMLFLLFFRALDQFSW